MACKEGMHRRRNTCKEEERHCESEWMEQRRKQRHSPEQRHHQIPLRHHDEHAERSRGSRVDGLEKSSAPAPVIDAALAPCENLPETLPVEAPVPAQVPGSVIFFRPLALEHGLGAAVVHLLTKVFQHGAAAMVPNHRAGMEAELPAALLETPAEIDVVAGDAELRIKTIDRLETFAAISHVAAREMFRLAVG